MLVLMKTPKTLTVDTAGFDGFGDYSRRADLDKNGALGFESDRGQRSYYGLYKESDSGNLLTAVIATPDYIKTGDLIALFKRLDGEAPTSGFTNFTGKYSGAIFPDGDGPQTLVEGDILVELDF